ncbi:MAG: YbhB/YbcL family Raf kinase inhibitor-like protein [Methylobacter sp.]
MNSIKPLSFIGPICLVFGIFFSAAATAEGESNMTLVLKSPDFSHQGEIPKMFTCDGSDTSPALNWSGLPESTRSLVLIVDDPDAPDPAKPKMTWVHWLLYNLPPTTTELPRAVTAANLPEGTQQGKNDWKKTGYGGPCPPVGRHRYFHKLYALDIELPDLHQPDKAKLEAAMVGHIVGHAELIGTYQR